ncbi:hypothetical protein B5M09_012727 [Aphanomyces astaci]|uniref:CCHC-type domain-containing protein n=1 Tax=Aphanomyces astaci TaxID=112090 RepID=A0A425CQ09_APHAT|nr:hypothetical protein B5M09_012727 [Aphanomyces astaci]
MSPTTSRSLLVLTDTNWNLWRTAFRGRLLAKGLMHVMRVHTSLMTDAERRARVTSSSTATQPDEKSIAVWQEDNQKALGLLIEMIDPSQYHLIEEATTCHDAYLLLERRHEPSTKVDRIALMAEYHAISWNPKQETLRSFLERFEVLLRKLQGADCVEPEHLSVVKLLALMPWCLRSVTHQINAKPEGHQTIHAVKVLLEAEYRAALASKEIQAPSQVNADERALATQARRDNNKGKKTGACHHCGKKGHWAKECREKLRGDPPVKPNPRYPAGEERANTAINDVYLFTATVDDNTAQMDADIMAAFNDEPSCAMIASVQSKQVVVDSGASMHMTNSESQLANIQPCERRVVMANGHVTHAKKSGDLSLRTSCGTKMVLKDVLVIDGMPMTLMSVPALLKANEDCEVMFKHSNCIVKVAGKTIATASTDSTGKVYVLDGHQMAPEVAHSAMDESSLWHQRIGHLPIAALKKCAEAGLGLPKNLVTNSAKSLGKTCKGVHRLLHYQPRLHPGTPKHSHRCSQPLQAPIHIQCASEELFPNRPPNARNKSASP